MTAQQLREKIIDAFVEAASDKSGESSGILLEFLTAIICSQREALEKYKNTKVPIGGDMSTGECSGFAAMALGATDAKLKAMGVEV